ncbi:uncharacterized protein F4812DRAFT_420773, partial [Daldinia caldariorum]|uniref:uncharacterized protein n=1 Tax=Daldinia caldariorum TaxID=326644 RepID=UPI0020081072
MLTCAATLVSLLITVYAGRRFEYDTYLLGMHIRNISVLDTRTCCFLLHLPSSKISVKFKNHYMATAFPACYSMNATGGVKMGCAT